MKKVLAMVVAVVAMVATGVAQKPKTKAAVSQVTAQASAQVVTATTGYVPVLTDSGGDLGDSMIFENIGTGNLGIGTATPLATLDVSRHQPDAAGGQLFQQRWAIRRTSTSTRRAARRRRPG